MQAGKICVKYKVASSSYTKLTLYQTATFKLNSQPKKNQSEREAKCLLTRENKADDNVEKKRNK